MHVSATADEDVVTVSVQDHGVGIPKEQQARIFERLVRLGGKKQAMAPGLGLGLYIAAELVKRQRGRIWVESIPGKGSTFSFTVPRHQPQGTRLAYEQEKKKHFNFTAPLTLAKGK